MSEIMSISGGRMNDPILGDIRVFREYLPLKDAIQYTVFFIADGEPRRSEVTIGLSELNYLGTQAKEDYVRDRIVDEVNSGNYVKLNNRCGNE